VITILHVITIITATAACDYYHHRNCCMYIIAAIYCSP
jgi:hypothetical protein